MRRLISILLTVLFLVPGESTGAQDLPWRALVYIHDPDRNPLHYTPAVIPDPADASGESWYAFTPGYLWHTDDMGVTVRLVSEIGRMNLMTSAMAVAHETPNLLYVATGVNKYARYAFGEKNLELHRFLGDGVYRSMDRGDTWVRLPFFEGVPPGRDLHILNSVATSARGDTLLVTTAQRILRSVDRGETWSVAHVLPVLIRNEGTQFEEEYVIAHAKLYHHPQSLENVFVTVRGTESGNISGISHHYVLASHDGGETWDYLRVDDQPPTPREDVDVLGRVSLERVSWLLAADPNAPNIFWAQVHRRLQIGPTSRRKLLRSPDGGRTWMEVPVDERGGGDWSAGNLSISLHVHPLSSDTLSMGWTIGHYQGGRLSLHGHEWGYPVHFLIPAPATTRGFRWVESNPGVHRGNPHAWSVAWTINELGAADAMFSGNLPPMPYMEDLCTVPLQAGADPSQRYIASRWHTYRGWRVGAGRGKTYRTSAASSFRAHSEARVGSGPGQTIHLFPDMQWPGKLSGLHCHPERNDVLRGRSIAGGEWVHPFSVSRRLPDRVWVGAWQHLFQSDDYGETLQEVTTLGYPPDRGRGTERIQIVHAHDTDPQVVYTDWAVSKDGGETWEEREIPDSLWIRAWDRVVSDPDSSAVIYSCSSASGLRKWGDYLQTDTTLAAASEYGPCRDLLVFPNNPDQMWMGTDTGLWETLDAGETWSRQNRGLPNVPITRINLSHDWEEILVATFGRGLFTVPATAVDMTLVSTTPGTEIPESSALLTNYPNPFTSETTLQFTASVPANVRLELFDVLGRRVAIVADQVYGRGMHQVQVDGTAMPSGVYFVRMETDGRQTGVEKIVKR